jgi:hypothetical protein
MLDYVLGKDLTQRKQKWAFIIEPPPTGRWTGKTSSTFKSASSLMEFLEVVKGSGTLYILGNPGVKFCRSFLATRRNSPGHRVCWNLFRKSKFNMAAFKTSNDII